MSLIKKDNVKAKKSIIYGASFLAMFAIGSAVSAAKDDSNHKTSETEISFELVKDTPSLSTDTTTLATSTEESSTTQSSKKEEEKPKKEASKPNNSELAAKEFDGTQTITINDNNPGFSSDELSMDNGAWEKYGDLDNLNRATSAEAMLNQSIMPTEKRGSISDVTPTGWKNKKIKSGYLYNRSHLIGHALAGEDANWKNLITGTQQLNNPEMLRHEMDIKYYLDQSSDNYVRYSVTPIFRDNELVARGVNMRAQSINSDSIKFNVYIFNVQDGVTINYSDGSSEISESELFVEKPKEEAPQQEVQQEVQQAQAPADQGQTVYVTPTGKKYHTHAHGRGNFSPSTLESAKASGLTPCNVCY
ncbi:hypothetical protein CBF34_07210 [Vagococcus penaei]|nr:hypothetical protein CBF34_07210 [Vagococcus penaei]